MKDERAPAWILSDDWHNLIHTPASLQGQWGLLFFFNIGCSGCTGRAIPFTRTLITQYPKLQIAAIHTDFESSTSRSQLKIVVDYLDLPYPVLRDDGDATFQAYAAEGTPHWYILNPNGNIQKSIFGSLGTALQRIDYTLAEVFESEIH